MWCVPSSRRWPWRLDRRGITSLEFALVAVVFFLLLFGAMDLSRYFLTWHGLNTLASEAARAWMVNNGSTYSCGHPTSGRAATVAGSAPFLDPSQLTLCVTVNQTTSSGVVTSTSVNVTASYPFSFMIPPLSAANGTLSAATVLTY
jgi:Flp pilus assembly protein TadG